MALVQFEFDKDDAAKLVSNDELGAAALNVTPIGLTLKPGFSIAGADVSLTATSALPSTASSIAVGPSLAVPITSSRSSCPSSSASASTKSR